MGLYEVIAKDIPWEIGAGTESYLKVVGGKLQLPNVKWLQYHLNYLDSIVEAINAFKAGVLKGISYDVSKIEKTIIADPIDAIKVIRDLQSLYTIFAIDIETSNLSTDKESNKLLCIGIAYAEDKGISILSTCFEDNKFKQLFNLFLNNRNKKFILHNGIFDKSRLKMLTDLDIKIDEDTLLMHYCGINEHKGTHGLKDLAQLYLGFPDWEKPLDEWKSGYCRQNKIKVKDFQYSYFSIEMLASYNVIDCCACYQLYEVFSKLMDPHSINIYHKLVEASKYYANMITRGMLLDIDYMEQLSESLEKQRIDLEEKLKTLMPNVLPTSPVQVLSWLRRTFPYDNIESADKFTIDQLMVKYPDNQALTTLLEYRKVIKYMKTYVVGLRERKDYQNIIHCEFKLHGTETGRLSSANPNMQNIPRNSLIKNLFISRPGYKFLQLDYSQSELRVLAYISDDQYLMQCYRDGRDLHDEIQKQLFKDKYDPHSKDQRGIAKTINFGIPYGRSAQGIADKLMIPLSEAKQYLKHWFDASPKVLEYMDKHRRMALAEPQEIYYTPFGRCRRYFITSANISHVRNQAINFPISSTANDLTIYSLVEIGKWLEQECLDAYLVNTVHDSIILEVRDKDAERIAKKCQDIMATIPQKYLPNVTMPFRADVDYGTRWGEMKEPDWEQEEEE